MVGDIVYLHGDMVAEVTGCLEAGPCHAACSHFGGLS